MSFQVTQSQPPKAPNSGNGLEEETQPPTEERKYKLEDFSQQAINSGQVEINYLLTVVNSKIVDALGQFKTAVEQLANQGQVDSNALTKAISDVHEANIKVAGPFPPGCGTGRAETPPPEPEEI